VSPPKQKRAPAKSALRSAEQLAGYVTSCVLQARRRMTRHCVACGAHVPNRNFSGYDGKGARIKSTTASVGSPAPCASTKLDARGSNVEGTTRVHCTIKVCQSGRPRGSFAAASRTDFAGRTRI